MSETLTALAGAPLLAFGVSLALAFFLTRGRAAKLALDRPNERSLHVIPVPRTGGIAILAATLAAWTTFRAAPAAPVLVALAMMACVSLLDDLRNVAAAVRFAVHLCAAGFVVYSLGATIPLVAQALLAIAVAWLANLYNFMDGSDGLAGGMAVIGFSCYAAAALFGGHYEFAVTNLIIAASAAGFLVFNFHPAKIFLGDVGSVPLGFLAGTFGVIGWHAEVWPLWFPLVVFSAFIVDSSFTLARRVWARARVWEAHRDHYYQRLVQMGWGHSRTALAEYALMAATGGLALAALCGPIWAGVAAIAATAAVYGLIVALIEYAWRSRTAAQPK
jgi:UDP-GlcNAc:undecaprenyl-phosphate/decaprenyl-phosphate GlcNAc-1-phosphate transferase